VLSSSAILALADGSGGEVSASEADPSGLPLINSPAILMAEYSSMRFATLRQAAYFLSFLIHHCLCDLRLDSKNSSVQSSGLSAYSSDESCSTACSTVRKAATPEKPPVASGSRIWTVLIAHLFDASIESRRALRSSGEEGEGQLGVVERVGWAGMPLPPPKQSSWPQRPQSFVSCRPIPPFHKGR
jgi:hypothetical protein